ncbi:hypothetical protein HHJ70_03260 [Mobiluncus curtisii]|nr:hypothetical protein [Mobiluncus curtisii]NMW45344.1 hypothetical protein [Mobiluncus curtisii]NMX00088.1 hypothetical protein [Mobiluncus curtisii]QQT14178.1 hypothetical protein I6I84_07410 [Mobiluncus curtisii]
MSARSRERRKRGKPESCVILEYVQDETSKPNQPEPSGGDGKAVAYGMIAGMMAGTALGFIMNNIALGLAIGVGVGSALGAGFSARKRPK